ncbi:UDP-N-acetylmuramoyl-L-alanyl-D-glutamate--2,6-diaminopimelate ligase [Clostridium sp. 'deep sea']|uniref:UDP-N-acetylmuramoyl-L-alanyl-D-glutamate--2, 6-diaminopimelate ligase n=1 Tax=Clostridium sp. 'deep sea' TaxID=2779445 RepID=UPI00189694B6|nr:UDP-N-acetylmuramoyl-L-alanyl-D-glutamate--2,6-diaminopimelate ligase [Clostridium sp. 'deep sea']QOR36222.1 UDP-N-acetylmuramoyl-L-alanyl-D-glutamate--2,6-diaminopimelate ligase [Clostridium sp. 'deep sea']
MKSLEILLGALNKYELHNIKPSILINKIEVDSRKIEKGDIFVCIKGQKVDGHNFATNAINNGAVVIVTEKFINTNVAQIVVPCTKTAISNLAAAYYDYPSKKLKVIGVTGTNGKSSTTFIVRHIFNYLGKKCGLVGTVEVDDGETVKQAKLTTPQPLELQRYFYDMVNNNCEFVVMEVSSHALDLHRVDNVEFNIAGFTNLTQDHLDYHETMQAYRDVKARLFEKALEAVIVNADDKEGEYMASRAKSPAVYYSCNRFISKGIFITDVKLGGKGTEFILHCKGKEYPVKTKLVGKFNIYNILLSFAIANHFAMDPQQIIQAIETFSAIPGRFESIESKGITVIIDFAHSPDGLANVLKTSRSMCKNKLIIVFGCGGDRDKTKRPIMGEMAAEYADNIIVTSDNPRTEDPKQIIEDICLGIRKHNTEFMVEVNRDKAIEYAINKAQKGDIILIAGKGHETYQIIGDKVLPFDDKLVAEQKLREVNEKCESGALKE